MSLVIYLLISQEKSQPDGINSVPVSRGFYASYFKEDAVTNVALLL
jgi:hypothetical protein